MPDAPVAAMPVRSRVEGVDSLRFLCAVCVFFSHGSAPPLETAFRVGSAPHIFFHVVTGTLWNGPAAVVIFFVISGFCIHYPYADAARAVNLPEFYIRRFLRLLIPVAVAVPIGHLAKMAMPLFHTSILWSLLAELIYYILYPASRLLRQRWGSWRPLIAVAYVVAFLLIATHPTITEYPLFSPWVIWLLGLPNWLLGCALAESVRFTPSSDVSFAKMWIWRLAVVLAMCASAILRFHAQIGFPWTFELFAILVAFWLRREITYRRHVPAWRWLEWAGAWSYSLYLMHTVVLKFYRARMPTKLDFTHFWVVNLLVFSVSYVFYLAVEKPGHFAARRLSVFFSGRRLVTKPLE